MALELPPAAYRLAAGALTLGVLLALERRFPLRRATQPKLRRVVVNLAVAATAAACVVLVYEPVVLGTVAWATRHEVGLTRWLAIPTPLAGIVAFVLLDLTLWVWHLANHHVPFLWRFHAAHHLDQDLDASTALRFHPGELFLSVGVRAAQVAVIGVDVVALLVWETVVLVSIELHHANLALPPRLDRALRLAIVTPRMHGIHHSIRLGELHSNFGTIFSAWDRLFRTFVRGVPQDTITVGVPGLAEGPRHGLVRALALPFERRPPPGAASETRARRDAPLS